MLPCQPDGVDEELSLKRLDWRRSVPLERPRVDTDANRAVSRRDSDESLPSRSLVMVRRRRQSTGLRLLLDHVPRQQPLHLNRVELSGPGSGVVEDAPDDGAAALGLRHALRDV